MVFVIPELIQSLQSIIPEVEKSGLKICFRSDKHELRETLAYHIYCPHGKAYGRGVVMFPEDDLKVCRELIEHSIRETIPLILKACADPEHKYEIPND